jgi:hypothetical protein
MPWKIKPIAIILSLMLFQVLITTSLSEASAPKCGSRSYVEKAPVINILAQKFSISGLVYNDDEGNGAFDNNDTGLADWKINLEQPTGAIIRIVTTSEDGKFAFTDLAAGEYTVSQVMQMGWKLIKPAEGKLAVTITSDNVSGIEFGNQIDPSTEN